MTSHRYFYKVILEGAINALRQFVDKSRLGTQSRLSNAPITNSKLNSYHDQSFKHKMTRMHDINLHDVSGDSEDQNGNKNLAIHMEDGDGLFQPAQFVNSNNKSIDTAFVYHRNDVIPRKRKCRQTPRTMFTCLAVCTSASSRFLASSLLCRLFC